MPIFWIKKKKEQAQQPPSLHGKSDTSNSWKEKKRKSQPIVSLHGKVTQTLLWGKMSLALWGEKKRRKKIREKKQNKTKKT